MPNAATGTLTSATPVAIGIGEITYPCTITLKSAAVGRLIEISTDGGVEYFTPVVDNSSTTMQVISITSPISHMRLTGANADTWSVR